MGDMLRDGLAWLTERLKDNVSQTITYARGYDSVDVQATFGNKLLKIDDGFGGIRMQWTDMDFIIPAADLYFSYGDRIVPHRGDLIYMMINDQVQTFEVFPFGNEPPWRFSDPNQSAIRVHTKLIDIESLFPVCPAMSSTYMTLGMGGSYIETFGYGP